MDEHRIKQRIIGAIVLVSLAVIFIPMILSGEREQQLSAFSTPIPDKPDNIKDIKVLEFENAPRPPEPARIIRSPVDEQSKPDDEPVVKTPAPDNDSDDVGDDETKGDASSKALTGWVVQVGSFSKQDNALALKNKLVKKGYSAFVEKISARNLSVYRVRVGPEVRKEEAIKLQKKIEQKMNIKGLVTTHP